MTAKGADFSALAEEDIIDITDHDKEQIPAAAALMSSRTLNAMILCDPPYTDICIDSRHSIPACLDDMAQIVGPAVRIVTPDEKQISKALTKATSVIVENSCLIAGGRNLNEAYTALTIIEKSAEAMLKAQVIGGVKPLDVRLARYMHHKYQSSYSKEETEIQSRAEENAEAVSESAQETVFSPREQELREKLVEYGKKLVEYGLVQGTWGNLSVMLDREYMLCTPSGLSYDRLTPEDMVKVSIHTLKSEGIHKPTSEKSMHAGIYSRYPEANAVIHTHSKYCSIFAAGEMPLQVESEEIMNVLGELIHVSRYALAGTRGITRNAVKAMKDAPGCILSHHGMIAMGADLEDAFRNVELIEEAARNYIDTRWEK
ncbi:MAG: class II aldolase/adducin family protein [Oscillospiraceae bacterium]|nr:class II aldolase/adducin family protein [Oscillospiraceae bacterium]